MAEHIIRDLQADIRALYAKLEAQEARIADLDNLVEIIIRLNDLKEVER